MTAQSESHVLQASATSLEYPDKGTGRTTTYTPATAELICARLADGETLTEICRTPGMPHRQTVHQWRMRIPAFNDLYARAREIGMESMSDDVLTIADDDTGDLLADGSPNSANVQRSRLMVDTRKFLMSKLAPKVYGDKVEHQHTGQVEHAVTLPDRERMRRLATFLAQDAAAGVTLEGQASPVLTEQASGASPPALPDLAEPAPAEPMDEPRARDDEI